MTPQTLHAILTALARDHDPPAPSVLKDLAVISHIPLDEIHVRIRQIQNEDDGAVRALRLDGV